MFVYVTFSFYLCDMSQKNPILDFQILSHIHPRYYKLFIADCFASISTKADKAEKIIMKQLDKCKNVKS